MLADDVTGVLHVEHDVPLVRVVPVDQIAPNPRQPRTVFDDEALAELAASIKSVGVLQPVVVRECGQGWELVMGERRLRAARLAGLHEVPAVVRDVPDEDLLRDALVENLQRAALNPVEEALAFQQLMADMGCTQEQLGAVVGRSRASVGHSLALLRLPESVQRRVAAGVLTAGHAKALAGVRDPWACERLAGRIVAEGMTVRTVEELVALGDLPGSEGDEPPRRHRSRRPASGLPVVENGLGNWLDTKVQVQAGAKRGRIMIDFADLEDLDRILSVLTGPAPDGLFTER
jgi:ParB family chromosome partitioning protein